MCPASCIPAAPSKQPQRRDFTQDGRGSQDSWDLRGKSAAPVFAQVCRNQVISFLVH